MLKHVLSLVKAMPNEFRAAPFWAWNAKLDEQELRAQIHSFHEMGIGGFFMHSRVGLATPYLGNEWFRCVNACADEAEKLGMNAWLYDEDRWPSGAAGGIVTKNKAFRMKGLAFTEIAPGAPLPSGEDVSPVALFAVTMSDGAVMTSYRKIEAESDRAEGEKVFAFTREIMPQSSWFNGQTYLDTMNPDAVREFLRVTHESYVRESGSRFRKSIPGIFTDEPSFLHPWKANLLPWTDGIAEKFQAEYHYDIREKLPELCFPMKTAEFSPARMNFINLCTTLFVNSMSKQVGEFCEKNQLQFTGHVLGEDSMITQTRYVGAAMRFYEYMQAPGIDLLTEHWTVYDTAKQCTSMAHQFQKKWRLSETYGCTGWDFPFFGHKALGDWQFALGINFRCPHLAWYSMEAQAKRDYPASISSQSPWFRQYPLVEDYFARLGTALSEGEEQRDLLVIHPIESAWGLLSLSDIGTKHDPDEQLLALRNLLLTNHIDFDYGDEEVMSRHASVSDGPFLKIAKAKYKAVLLPELRTIRASTLKLLEQFAASGGNVFRLGKRIPEFMDGIPSQKPAELFRSFHAVTEKTIPSKLAAAARRVSVTDESGAEIAPVLLQLRKGADFQTLFLCNTGMDPKPFRNQLETPCVRDRKDVFPSATVSVSGVEKDSFVYELSLESGKLIKIPAEIKRGTAKFQTSFPELGSRLFFLTKEKPDAEDADAGTSPEKTKEMPFEGWQIRRDEPNVLLLDQCEYSVNGGAVHAKDYILNIDTELRKQLGVNPRGGAMVQPWLNANAEEPKMKLNLRLRYSVECAVLPETPLFLALERPDFYSITINGKTLKQQDAGFWVDRSLRKLFIAPGMFREGGNTIELVCEYHAFLPGLEAMFLLGEFGVEKATDIIGVLPQVLPCGDICSYGFPYYSGNLTYCRPFKAKKGKRLFLRVNDWRGAAYGISVNGSKLIPVGWAPYETDISGLVKDGTNTLEITIFGTRRNSHGPFYLKGEETTPAWCGAEKFQSFEHSNRNLVPFGMLSAPELIER